MHDSSCPSHRLIGILLIVFGLLPILEMFGVVTPYIIGIVRPTLLVLMGLKLAFPDILTYFD